MSALDNRDLTFLDVSFTLSFARPILSFNQLFCHQIRVCGSHFSFLKFIVFGLAGLLKFLYLSDVAVLHQDKTLVLFHELC